jgi:hypothetical protein
MTIHKIIVNYRYSFTNIILKKSSSPTADVEMQLVWTMITRTRPTIWFHFISVYRSRIYNFLNFKFYPYSEADKFCVLHFKDLLRDQNGS